MEIQELIKLQYIQKELPKLNGEELTELSERFLKNSELEGCGTGDGSINKNTKLKKLLACYLDPDKETREASRQDAYEKVINPAKHFALCRSSMLDYIYLLLSTWKKN